jgi:hypothetical protein
VATSTQVRVATLPVHLLLFLFHAETVMGELSAVSDIRLCAMHAPAVKRTQQCCGNETCKHFFS